MKKATQFASIEVAHDLKSRGDDTTNYMLWDKSLNTLLVVGTAAKFKLGAFTGAASGTGSALSATNSAAFRVYADDGGAAIGSGTLARAGVFRNLLTFTDGNREQEAAGVIGQVVSVAGTNRHNMAGTWGSYEARTSLVVDGQAATTDTWVHAGVLGRVGGTSITINTNGVLAGVASMSNVATALAANDGVYAGLYVGKWSGTETWSHGLYIQALAVDKAIQVGELSSTVSGSGVALTNSVTRVMEVHADDNNAARTAGIQGRAIFGRTMIYYSGTTQENWGIDGLVKWSTVAHTGNVNAGVVGRFEAIGTNSTATGIGNTFVAGVMGRIGIASSAFTIGTGTWAVGVLAFYNTLTANNPATGYTAAFMATASDIAGYGDWDYGLYVEDTTTGIAIADGTTTGIVITGASGYAIDIATTGQFRMGVQGTGIPTATTTPYAVEIHAETNADAIIEAQSGGVLGTGITTGIRCRYEISKAQTAQIGFQAIEGRLRVKADLADGLHCGVSGTIEADAAMGFTGTATTQRSAGNFCVELGSTCVFGTTSGWLTGVTIDSSVHATQTGMANIEFAGLRIKKASGKLSFETGIFIDGECSTVAIQAGIDASDGGDVRFYGAVTTEAFLWDSSAATLDITSTTTAADDMVSIIQTNNSTAASGYHRTLYVLTDHDGDMSGSASMETLGVDLVVQDDVPSVRNISCWTGFYSSATMTEWSAIYAHADALVTTSANIHMLNLEMVTSTRSTGPIMAFMHFYAHTGPSGMKQVMYLHGTGGIADFFVESAKSTAIAPFEAGDITSGKTVQCGLRCKVGGTVYVIPLYND